VSDRVPEHVSELLAQSLAVWRVSGDIAREAAGGLRVTAGDRCLRISRTPAELPFRWMVDEGGRKRGVASIAGLLRAMRGALDRGYRPVRLRIAPLPLLPP
jgi:hypothetical protein